MDRPVFEIERHVEFFETDMAGVVHFSNFFRYIEICEHAFVRSLGARVIEEAMDSGWPRVHASCDYRAPAHFGDLLTIRLFIEEVRERSLRYRFEVARGETLIAEGRLAVAHIRKSTGKAAPLPPDLKARLEAMP